VAFVSSPIHLLFDVYCCCLICWFEGHAFSGSSVCVTCQGPVDAVDKLNGSSSSDIRHVISAIMLEAEIKKLDTTYTRQLLMSRKIERESLQASLRAILQQLSRNVTSQQLSLSDEDTGDDDDDDDGDGDDVGGSDDVGDGGGGGGGNGDGGGGGDEGGDDGWIVFESNDDVSDNDFLL